MKKLLLSILIFALTISDVLADEINEDGQYQLILKYKKEPTYFIKIPTSIDISQNQTSFDIYVKGAIYCDQILSIDFDKQVELTNGNKYEYVDVSFEKDSFKYDELNNEYTNYSVNLEHFDLTAGTWSGQLNMLITLKGEQK